MASIGSSVLPASSAMTSPGVLNVTLLLAATEYTLTIPIGVKHFSLQARGATTLQISEIPGNSGSVFFTVRPYGFYNVDSLTGSGIINLYVQSTKPNQIIEIAYWV